MSAAEAPDLVSRPDQGLRLVDRSDRPLDLVSRQAHDTGCQATAGQGAVGVGLKIGMRRGAGRIKSMMAMMLAAP